MENRLDNTKGRATFEAWYNQSAKNGPWKLTNTTLGAEFTEKITVTPVESNDRTGSVGSVNPSSDAAKAAQNARDIVINNISGALGTVAQALRDSTNQSVCDSYDAEKQTAIVLGSNGVVPELNPNNYGNILLVDKIPLDEESDNDVFDLYLENAVFFYSVIKTLLYSEKPQKFYDFYICNNLHFREYGFITKDSSIIANATIPALSKESKYAVIRGTGGIGKSMMMRHLFMDSAEAYEETGNLPILCLLKN